MPIKNILVTGGAGYIGSHMIEHLEQHNYRPIILDNLTTGHYNNVDKFCFEQGELADKKILTHIFSQYDIAAVMHFAAFISVNESIQQPAKYYQNNVVATLTLLDCMHKAGVKNLIFSSSAAVYGEPRITPIDESHPLVPLHPYGHSKKMVEQIITDYAVAYGLKYMILRYFNAAGAHPHKLLGECHHPETHLIPLIMQVALKKKPILTIFGNDYPTPDGTCIRDYIHVMDIVSAHFIALEALLAHEKSGIYNLGSGQGYSVQQVIDAASMLLQQTIAVQYLPKRCGDPAMLIADTRRAYHELHWQPVYSELSTILQHAWQFAHLTQ